MGPVTKMILETTLADDLEALRANPKFNVSNNPNAQSYLAGNFKFAPAPKSDEEKSYGHASKLTAAEQKIYDMGREIYSRDAYCTTCHQPNGLGLPGVYPALIGKDNPWISGSDERLIKIVLKGLWGPMPLHGQLFDPSKGVPPMTGFGGLLNDEEVAAVLSYVRQSFGNDLPFINSTQVVKTRAQTAARQDFYLVEDLMREHPIPGWEQWPKASMTSNPFE